jgi:hypothetical protein
VRYAEDRCRVYDQLQHLVGGIQAKEPIVDGGGFDAIGDLIFLGPLRGFPLLLFFGG